MQTLTLVLLAGACLLATADAAGQYYVPRAYYTIDNSGHETPSVPLRRLRRSLHAWPAFAAEHASSASANANANANANSWGGEASASANANAHASSGGGDGAGWYPGGHYPSHGSGSPHHGFGYH